MGKDWGGGPGQTVITPPAQLKLNLVVRSVGFEVPHRQAAVPAPRPAMAGFPGQASVSPSIN